MHPGEFVIYGIMVLIVGWFVIHTAWGIHGINKRAGKIVYKPKTEKDDGPEPPERNPYDYPEGTVVKREGVHWRNELVDDGTGIEFMEWVEVGS